MAKNQKKPENRQDSPQEDQEPKIVVDDDWKAQAAAEKEKLAEQVEAAGQEDQGPAGEAGGRAGPRQLPAASFSTLVNSLAMQALLALGGYEDPKTKKRLVDLSLAKHHIDSLAVLEEKTKGNLTDEERKTLDKALYETRMQYVQFAQRVGSL